MECTVIRFVSISAKIEIVGLNGALVEVKIYGLRTLKLRRNGLQCGFEWIVTCFEDNQLRFNFFIVKVSTVQVHTVKLSSEYANAPAPEPTPAPETATAHVLAPESAQNENSHGTAPVSV